MPNVVSPGQVAAYLSALETDEVEIVEAGAAFEIAKARLDVALRRYVALRDFIAEVLGESPYHPRIKWPGDGSRWGTSDRGRFRFAGMKVGDAVVAALRERHHEPKLAVDELGQEHRSITLSLRELTTVLSEGGLGFPEPVSGRAVNAALMKTAGVVRSAKGPFRGDYFLLGNEDMRQLDDEEDVDDETDPAH